ncbi:MAG: hypothetical protein HXL43_00740 [Solobacterium sp.]|nr:hypothetical protein [Solobacterium sp.]
MIDIQVLPILCLPYKGNMNGTVENHLLEKVVDEENHITYYKRNFSTSTVNEKWTTDVSEFHITACKLYLLPFLDMNNREIVLKRTQNMFLDFGGSSKI